MIHIPIEQRYDKSKQMFHSGAFVAAGTIISVAAAGAGAYMSTQAANKAAAAQSSAAKKYGQGLDQIQIPQWNIAQDIKGARKVTKYNIGELEKIFPGATSQRQIAARATESYLKGEIPKDVQDEIMRSVAELGGAGFAPQAGVPQVAGFQAPQGLLARQLGLTSLGLQQTGMQLSQGWQKLAGAFIESPLQVGQARLGFEKAAADIQLGIEGGKYGAAVNTIGANLAASQALASGIASTGQALGSGISSYGMANAAAQGAGTIDYKGQDYGSVKGYGGQTYSPAVSESGGLYYKAQPSSSAQRALTGGYG